MNATDTHTTPAKTHTQPPVIGRTCLVQDHKAKGHVFVGATVIDKVHDTNRAKRIRLQTGPAAGEVRMPGEYTIMEFTD